MLEDVFSMLSHAYVLHIWIMLCIVTILLLLKRISSCCVRVKWKVQYLLLRAGTAHMKTVLRNRSLLQDGHCQRTVVARTTLYQVTLCYAAATTWYWLLLEKVSFLMCVNSWCLTIFIISLAIRQCAAWSSTLIAHNFPLILRRKPREQEETHASSLPPFCASLSTPFICCPCTFLLITFYF